MTSLFGIARAGVPSGCRVCATIFGGVWQTAVALKLITCRESYLISDPIYAVQLAVAPAWHNRKCGFRCEKGSSTLSYPGVPYLIENTHRHPITHRLLHKNKHASITASIYEHGRHSASDHTRFRYQNWYIFLSSPPHPGSHEFCSLNCKR